MVEAPLVVEEEELPTDDASLIATPVIDPSQGMPTPEMLKPELVWHEWKLEGPLPPEKLALLRSFFAPEVEQYAVINERARRHLAAYTRSIGFQLVTITVNTSGQRAVAILHIEPATWVRRVRVTVPFAIFKDEIARRMNLKAGSRLDDDPTVQEQQLRVEAVRLETYLRNQGYFEACVEIQCVSGKKSQQPLTRRCQGRPGSPIETVDPDQMADLCTGTVELAVEVKKGPRYEFGDIEVVSNEDNELRGILTPFQPRCILRLFCLRNNFSLQGLKSRLQKVARLYQRNGYPAVRVRTDFDPATSVNHIDKQVEFQLFVNERRKIAVLFEGSFPSLLTESKLRSLLTFNDEGSYDDVEASAAAIRSYLQSRGYFEANVVYQRERLPFLDNVIFTIDAGAYLTVAATSFSGNRDLPTADLKKVIRTESGRSVSAGQIQGDVDRLLAYYRKLGYADIDVDVRVSRSLQDRDNAAVLAALVASGAGQKGIYVRYEIDEGKKTLVNSVGFVFKGRHRFTEAELAKVVSLRAGQPYYDERVDKGHDELERYYFQQAHPQAKITSDTRPSDRPGYIDIIYNVIENPKVRIGKVLVQGNFKTEDWVILDELGFREGMELSLENAEVGGQNLRATGLFNAVQVSFLNLDKNIARDINVLVRVQERYDYRLSLELAGGVTISSDLGAFIETGAATPNLLGKGMRLDLRARLGTQFSSAEGKFTAPRWLVRRFMKQISGGRISLPWRFEAAAFWRRDQTPRFGDLTSFGGSLALSKVFRRGVLEGVLVSFRYDLRQRNREEDLVRPPGPSEDLQRAPVATRTGAIGPQISIDRRRDSEGRRNPLTPSSGFKLDLRALWATPYLLGQDDFFKLGFGLQHFWRPTPRILITTSLRYDHGIPRSDVVLPEVERYFAGGDTTVRGVAEDRLATEIIEDALPPFGNITQLRVLPAGGNIRLIQNLDIQLQVWELAGAPVASGIFLDTGLVRNSLNGLHYRDFRHSLGIALARWVHPFGSISLEWAMPLDPQLGDNPRGRWHFNFGLPF